MKIYILLVIIVVPLTAVLVVSRLLRPRNSVNRQSNQEKKHNKTLRIPLLYRIVMIMLFCCMSLISLYILVFQLENWPYILLGMGGFGIPSLIAFILWSLWKIDYTDDGFIYRNYCGRKKEYKYRDLKLETHPKGLKWYFYKDGKKILCLAYYIDGEEILRKLYKKNKEQ